MVPNTPANLKQTGRERKELKRWNGPHLNLIEMLLRDLKRAVDEQMSTKLNELKQ